MIRKLCINFVDFICEDNFNNEDKEIMEYVLRVLVFEFLKFAGNLLIFYLLGYFTESLLITISTSITKPFIGGYHCSTQFRCFMVTIIMNAVIILLSNNCILSFPSLLLIISVSWFAIYHQAPIINENMPLTKPELIKKNRKHGLINLTLISLIAISIYFFSIHYSYVLTWSILSLAILMFNRLSWLKSIK